MQFLNYGFSIFVAIKGKDLENTVNMFHLDFWSFYRHLGILGRARLHRRVKYLTKYMILNFW